MKKMMSASMALLVMDEPQVGPDGRDADLVRRAWCRRRRRARGRDAVAGHALAWWSWPRPLSRGRRRLRRAGRQSRAFWTFAHRVLLGLRQLLRSAWTLSVCLLPCPSSCTIGSMSPVRLHGVGRLRLGDAGRLHRPLGAALELDAEVQPAAQDDGDDPRHDDEGGDGEPDPAARRSRTGSRRGRGERRAVTPPRPAPGGRGRRRPG